MSLVDVICDTMRGQLDQADNVLTGLEILAPGATRDLANLSLKPFPLAGQAVEDELARILLKQVRDAIAHLREYIPVLREMVNSFGSPDRLREAASQLSSDVGDASGTLSAAMGSGHLQGLRPSNWSGSAAEEYVIGFPGQPDAVDRIAGYSASLHDALRSLADGIEQFYLELAIAVTGLLTAVIGLAVAIPEAATVAGIPLAIGTAVVAQLGVNAALLSLGAVFLTLTQTVGNSLDSLDMEFAPWPTPTIR